MHSLFIFTMQINKQLASTEGLLGYSVLSRPFSKKFWTLSAWKDDAALHAFVKQQPHLQIMAALAPHLRQTKFLRWTVSASQLPLSWKDALRRFENDSC